jgi:hypothetical protein
MESHQGEEEDGDSRSQGEQVGGENDFGFKGMEDPVMDKEKKRAREESEESKALKKEILKLVSRYPKLELRTSRVIMDKLNEMSEDDLRIVRDNCISDLSELRGTPVSAFVLFCITQPVDYQFLPGYTDQCMSDQELKRDVESEMIAIFGDLSNRINIFFRLLNNAYITWKRLKGEYTDYASRPRQEPDESVGTEPKEGDEEKRATTNFSKSPW